MVREKETATASEEQEYWMTDRQDEQLAIGSKKAQWRTMKKQDSSSVRKQLMGSRWTCRRRNRKIYCAEKEEMQFTERREKATLCRSMIKGLLLVK